MSEITITILGTTAGVPTRERGHSSIHLSYRDREEDNLLFDCGEGTQRQIMRAGLNIMKLDAVFITHWHGDHCLGIPGLLDTLGFEGRSDVMRVYAPQARRVRQCMAFSYSMAAFPVKTFNVPYRGGKMHRVLETERYRVLSTPVKHSIPAVAYAFVEKERTGIDIDKAMALGLPGEGDVYRELKDKGRVSAGGKDISLAEVTRSEPGRKIVYSGDTEICPSLRELVSGADLLIQDCTYFEPQGVDRPHRHAALPEVLEMLQSSGVKRAILTHISRKHQDIGQLRDIVRDFPDVEVAEDMMVVSL